MSLFQDKELPSVPVTSLLCEVTLSDGASRFWADSRCLDGSREYEARIHPGQSTRWKLTSDVSSESAGQLSLVLADHDGSIAQLYRTGMLLGAKVQFSAAILSGRNVTSKTVLWTGLLDTVSDLDGASARLNVMSRLSAIRSSFPPMRIQKECSWAFPSNSTERQLACGSGEDGRYSPLFRCGYSPDVAGGAGNLDGAQPFTSCNFTRRDCESRGMFSKDSANRPTNRFSGFEFIPPSFLVRGHGESSGRVSNLVSLDTRYNDVVPVVYGQGWLQAPVVFSRNDGNLTRSEVLLGLGEIDSVIKVVADGYEIPEGVDGRNQTGTGWYNLVSTGNRNGNRNLGFADGSGAPVGDPYGSMAYLNLVLPNRINDGKRSPKVQVLLKGLKLPILSSTGDLESFSWSANPAWILCDILRRTGWKLPELDLASFRAAASFCDQTLEARDANGNLRQVRRFECNLVLNRRYSVGELLRSLRLGSLLFLFYQPDGRLAVRPESTIAAQQPVKPAGSNAPSQVNSGWPVYEFGEGLGPAGGILVNSRREPEFRVFSRPSQDSPNRVSFEIQDSLNEFQQDSISIADTDDIRLRRQEVNQALPATGVPNFAQAQRICQTALNKSIAGNFFIQFRTSIRGVHIRPGDLIAVSYSRYGFDRTLFRVLEFHLSSRLDEMEIVAQLHQDHWYSDDPATRYDRSRIYAWSSASSRAICGTVVDQGVIRFEASESLAVDDSGAQRCRLHIPFRRPLAQTGSTASVPLVSFSYSVASTGGSLAPGSYFYALTAVDAQGRESLLSSLVPVRLTSATSTNRVTLTGISADSATQSLRLYRGSSPNALLRVAAALPVSSSVTDTGTLLEAQLPPDPNYSRLRAWFRQVYLVDQAPTAWTPLSITRTALNLIPDRWTGKKLVIRSGKGAGQERVITANTADTIQFAVPWLILPDASSRFAIVETAFSFAAESDTSDIDVLLPLQTGSSFEVSLRSVARDNSELDPLDAPSLLWQVGVGASGGSDAGLPPEPAFTINLIEEGTIAIGPLSFTILENLSTVYLGQLGLLYWDELSAPTPLSLAATLSPADSTLSIAGLAAALPEGAPLQIEEEILEVSGAPVSPGVYPVLRSRYGTPAAACTSGTPVFTLSRLETTIPFAPGYFNSFSALGFRHHIRLPNVRLSAAGLVLWNRLGPGARGEANYTALSNFGIRCLSGGQLINSIQGYLAIEASAGNSLVLDRKTVVRDVFAYVQEPPTGAAILILVRVNGNPYCELTIAPGNFTSNSFNAFNLPALPATSRVTVDILNVPSAAQGLPGKDLNVVLQL
ncbi:MAG: phage tail protein [Acidobacteriota bacterium]